jgi:hypothetical protein
MADTRRELILARLKTNLDAIAGATVYRSRVEPLARGEGPCCDRRSGQRSAN